MSLELRKQALDAALCIVHKLDGQYAEQTVTAAEMFLAFLTGESSPKAEAAAAVKAPAAPAAAPAPATPATGSSAPTAATPAAAAAEPVKYDADAVSAKVALNRPAVIELLGRYGAKKGSQVKEADVPEFMAELAKIGAAS